MKPIHTLLLLAAFCAPAFPQTGFLAPVPQQQYFDTSTGQVLPCVNCTLSTFAAGTVTPLATYTDNTAMTTNPTVITLNSAGYIGSGLWLTAASCWKFVLANAAGATVWSQDNICVATGPAGATGAAGAAGAAGPTGPQGPAGGTKDIASGTAVMGTSAIGSLACATVVTVAATGVLTTDNIMADFNADPTSTTGYAVSALGQVTIYKYPTAGNVNFKICNGTAASITPGAATFNWSVVR